MILSYLPGFSIRKVKRYQPLVLELSYNQLPRCAHCNSKKVRKKASYIRNVHHELIRHRRSILQFKAFLSSIAMLDCFGIYFLF